MKIRKFEGKNLEEALLLVKKAMGSQAVVVSIKEYKKSFGLAGEKSVEVSAVKSAEELSVQKQSSSLSYEQLILQQKEKVEKEEFLKLKQEILHMKSQLNNHKGNHSPHDTVYVQKVFEELICAGLSPGYAFEILRYVEGQIPKHSLKNISLIKAYVSKYIMNQIPIAKSSQSLFHLFLGAPQAGKTSVVMKFSQYLYENKKKIAILSLCEKSHKLLKNQAMSLGIPFGFVEKPSDWKLAYEKLKNFDNILVDFPSFDFQKNKETQDFKKLLPPDEISYQGHLVQSCALAHEKTDLKIAQNYQDFASVDDLIFTHLDKTQNYGMILNFQKSFQKPLHSFSLSSENKKAFQLANKQKLVSLLFDFTDTKAYLSLS